MTTAELIKERIRELAPDQQQIVLHMIEALVASSSRKPMKSLHGIWRGVSVTEADIDEARKEMWGNFPREDIA